MTKVKRYEFWSAEDYQAAERELSNVMDTLKIARKVQPDQWIAIHFFTKCFRATTAVCRFFKALNNPQAADKWQAQFLKCLEKCYTGKVIWETNYRFMVNYDMQRDCWEVVFAFNPEIFGDYTFEPVHAVYDISNTAGMEIQVDNNDAEHIKYRVRVLDNPAIPAWTTVKLYSNAAGDLYFNYGRSRVYLKNCYGGCN